MTPLWLALALFTSAEPAVAPPTEPPPCNATSFVDCLVLSIGLGLSGDAYAPSSVSESDTGKPQRSLLGGFRFWLGTRWPNVLALRGVFDFGYVTVGPFPTRGTDGLFEAAGLELSLDMFSLVKPFVRFMYEAVIQRLPNMGAFVNDTGVLKSNAFFFQAGAMLSVVELHLSIGRDFAGGVAPGLGFSLAWIY